MTALRTVLARRRSTPRAPAGRASAGPRRRRRTHAGVRARDHRAGRPPLGPRVPRAGQSCAGSREQANRNAGGTFSSEIRWRTVGKSRRSSLRDQRRVLDDQRRPPGRQRLSAGRPDAPPQPGSSDVNGSAQTRTSARSPSRCFSRCSAESQTTCTRGSSKRSSAAAPGRGRSPAPPGGRPAASGPGSRRSGTPVPAPSSTTRPAPGHVPQVEHVPDRVPRGRQDRPHLTGVCGEGAQEAHPIGDVLVHAASGARGAGPCPTLVVHDDTP